MALLLLLSAIATSAALNLAFTLPLLLLGFSLLALAQVRGLRRWKPLADGTVILGMTAVMAGVAFSVVNGARSGWLDALSSLRKPRPAAPVDSPQPSINRGAQVTTEKPAPKPATQVLVIDEPSQHVADYGTASCAVRPLGERSMTSSIPLMNRGIALHRNLLSLQPLVRQCSLVAPSCLAKDLMTKKLCLRSFRWFRGDP
ncbi:MAG: hypothetical protein EBZ24_11020 [Synechococcaceae bacterium WB9_4xB_025]|nr:hypothetical protein [Synechococcaceae bacterium WB9_4xB_025]